MVITSVVFTYSILQYKLEKIDMYVFGRALDKNIELSTLVVNQSMANYFSQFLLQKCRPSSPGFETVNYNKEECDTVGGYNNAINPLIDKSKEYLSQKTAALNEAVKLQGIKSGIYRPWLLVLNIIFYTLSTAIIVLNAFSLLIKRKNLS